MHENNKQNHKETISYVHSLDLYYVLSFAYDEWKSAQRRRKHCALAVVRRTHKQTDKQTGAITIHCAA